jgi:hypothetical protein
MGSTGSPFVDKGRLRAFSKGPSAKRARELLNFNRNQLRIEITLLTQHCSSKDIYLNGADRQSWVSRMQTGT